MRLAALLAGVPAEHAPLRVVGDGADDVPIRGIAIDSRAVVPGDLFVALRGAAVDGHEHLAQAIELGAAAVVVERVPADVDLRGRAAVVVRDTRRSLAPLAARFFGDPAQELSLVGVTGTNGKTSTTFLLESILAAAGRRTGLIGTVEMRYAGERLRSINTTPESLDLQRLLRAMRTRGVDAVVMEVSSHGLALGRVDGCRFDVAAFTNLTQDHLDFHRTMEAYRDAKTRLFREHLRPGAGAVVNVDDPAAPEFLAAARDGGGRRDLRRAQAGAPASTSRSRRRTSISAARAHACACPAASLDARAAAARRLQPREPARRRRRVRRARDSRTTRSRAASPRCPQVPGRVERVDGGPARRAHRARRLRAHARRGRQAAAHRAPAGARAA